MKTDIEIAQNVALKPIDEIAEKIAIPVEQLEHYGKYKAKINIDKGDFQKPQGKLILVTSINPTPAGEGKTTMSVGLGDALQSIGEKTAIALREPSLGPVFGIKGGAAGGGHAQVVPMEDLNLHFTGDMHAIGAANNLAAAMLDNHIKQGKLILVTSINPTPAGEGKTTMSVGLGDALQSIGEKTAIALREPSLGPVFGIKGGAAGGGHAQVVPMEDLNLHFTGDMHAIGAANNLAAAMLDNHIKQGNSLNIDPRRVTWKRAVDMNDRQLRNIISGLGGPVNGTPREDGFEITVASEIMAVLCLAEDLDDLKTRLKRCILAYTFDNEPVTVGDIQAEGAMTVLLKDALKPNLVQTLEGTPAFIHGGPFANIAHGCNSVLATKMALSHADYVVTEGGFGGDLGAEKFMDIKCRSANIEPDAVVVVATIRALKMHGGVARADLKAENLEALNLGFSNLQKHVENMQNVFGMNTIVAINSFSADTEAEKVRLIELCENKGYRVVLADVWGQGGAGGEELAHALVEMTKLPSTLTHPYDLSDSIEEKITKVVQKVYGGAGLEWSTTAKRALRRMERLGFDNLPVCMAKTQYSFSDNPKLLGRPEGFTVAISDLTVSAGAGFIVVLTGDVMKMPGLPKTPAAETIDIDADGKITGLF